MQFTKDFKELSIAENQLAGGKGHFLSKLARVGLSVPPGFIILSSAFENFLETNHLKSHILELLQKINYRDASALQTISKEIVTRIKAAAMPGYISEEILAYFKKLHTNYVAVRSSASCEDSTAASWAGVLDTFLNTTRGDLLENIKKCWASLFSPQAIIYQIQKQIKPENVTMAVVVQTMVQSEVSGVVFSMHPISRDKNQIIIQASFGLGEAAASGRITPDCYIVQKRPFKIIKKVVAEKTAGLYLGSLGNKWEIFSKEKMLSPALTDEQILVLSDLIMWIEKHFNFPCDVEWAIEKEQWYVLQTRPITALGKTVEPFAVVSELDILAHAAIVAREMRP